ncbi:hypothetical protein BpHYR1_027102 [Brachionus plicatilis]|uniref:Uncharacterized protein n=1 Tax=Brachionus plicatilis TaxID=10195 RepID=A0A3M7SLQ3_BRAPC|nr:hypothetical protein BpHYR1_027102 [Brachionus plicatilis]
MKNNSNEEIVLDEFAKRIPRWGTSLFKKYMSNLTSKNTAKLANNALMDEARIVCIYDLCRLRPSHKNGVHMITTYGSEYEYIISKLRELQFYKSIESCCNCVFKEEYLISDLFISKRFSSQIMNIISIYYVPRLKVELVDDMAPGFLTEAIPRHSINSVFYYRT